MKKPIILYPFLVAVHTMVFLYAQNRSTLQLTELVVPLFLVTAGTFLVFFSLNVFIRQRYKTACVTALVMLVVTSYGFGFDFLRLTSIGPLINGKHTPVMIVLSGILFFLSRYIVTRKTDMRFFTRVANIVMVSLVSMSVVQIVLYSFQTLRIRKEFAYTAKAPVLPNGTQATPDVYYFIFDRYASRDTMQRDYQYDNSEFITSLEKKNFYVAGKSWANYASTALSLASSLNYTYLDDVLKSQGAESTDETPLYTMIERNKVWQFLKDRGYTFVHVGSHWGPTVLNRYADQTIRFSTTPEFWQYLYDTSIFHPVSAKLGISVLDGRFLKWERNQYKFKELEKIPEMKEPTFVFAHFLLPHEPYVFNRDGSFVSVETLAKRTEAESYGEQARFSSKKIDALVTALLEKSPDPKPIIIVQSDEGPYPDVYRKDPIRYDWKTATAFEIRQKMTILNAYYLPGMDMGLLYPSITPVNTFRLVFSYYFGADLPLLPDRSYLSNKGKQYAHLPVPDKLLEASSSAK